MSCEQGARLVSAGTWVLVIGEFSKGHVLPREGGTLCTLHEHPSELTGGRGRTLFPGYKQQTFRFVKGLFQFSPFTEVQKTVSQAGGAQTPGPRDEEGRGRHDPEHRWVGARVHPAGSEETEDIC